MANLVLFGVPYGFRTSKCKNEDAEFLGLFYVPNKPGTYLKVLRRPDNTIHYVFLMYEKPNAVFLDSNGRSGSFFGIDLSLKGQSITNTQVLSKLFQKIYDEYVKGKIIQEFPNGNRKYLINDFDNKNDTWATYVVNGMNTIMQQNPELNLGKYIQPLSSLPPQQKDSRV